MAPSGSPALHDALAAAVSALRAAAVPEPRREAQLLLAHVLDAPLAYVLTHAAERLDPVRHALYCSLVARRARREPFAYLTGVRAWLDMELAVDRNVLIPRPETELLAQATIAEVQRRATGQGSRTVAPVVVDVGTGSGALAIAIARACPGAAVYATDASPGALRAAARNIEHLAVGRVRLLACDLLSGVRAPAEVVVANLPYIPSRDLPTLEPEIAFEPRAALDGGVDGLVAIRALLAQASGRVAPGGVILLECGHDQAGSIASLTAGHWPGARIDVRADLAIIERFVYIHLPA